MLRARAKAHIHMTQTMSVNCLSASAAPAASSHVFLAVIGKSDVTVICHALVACSGSTRSYAAYLLNQGISHLFPMGMLALFL